MRWINLSGTFCSNPPQFFRSNRRSASPHPSLKFAAFGEALALRHPPRYPWTIVNLTAVIHRWSLGLVVGLALSFVCNSSSAAPGPALDFESSTHWSLREGAGPISLSAEASSGEHSLEVGGSGWRRIGSIPLSTVGAQENTVWLDVEPTHVPQAWEGVGVVLRIGSLQLWWADLGTNSIAGLIPGEFSTLAFTLPEAVRSQLNASYSDLEVLITVNSSAPVRL